MLNYLIRNRAILLFLTITSSVIVLGGCAGSHSHPQTLAMGVHSDLIYLDFRNNRYEYILALEKMRAQGTEAALPLDINDVKRLFPEDDSLVCGLHAQCLLEWPLTKEMKNALLRYIASYGKTHHNSTAAIWSYAVLQEHNQLPEDSSDLIMTTLQQSGRKGYEFVLIAEAIDAIVKIVSRKTKYLEIVTQLATNTTDPVMNYAAEALAAMGQGSLRKYPVVLRAIRNGVKEGRTGEVCALLRVVEVWGYLSEEDEATLDLWVRDVSQDEILRRMAMAALVSDGSKHATQIIEDGMTNEALRGMSIYGKKLIYGYGVDLYPRFVNGAAYFSKIFHTYHTREFMIPIYEPWDMSKGSVRCAPSEAWRLLRSDGDAQASPKSPPSKD
jgi:uncharacterized protein YciU (UPF0263 family)